MARQVVSKCYCLPRDIAKWLDGLSSKQSKSQRRRVSTSSILSDILVEVKKKKSSK